MQMPTHASPEATCIGPAAGRTGSTGITPSVTSAGDPASQPRALPLISRQSRGPHRARLRGGVESP